MGRREERGKRGREKRGMSKGVLRERRWGKEGNGQRESEGERNKDKRWKGGGRGRGTKPGGNREERGNRQRTTQQGKEKKRNMKMQLEFFISVFVCCIYLIRVCLR